MGALHQYDELLEGPIVEYIQLSAQVGGAVQQQAELVQKAFQAQREFIRLVTCTPKPAEEEIHKLLKPTSEVVEAINFHRDQNRTSVHFNHLSSISESITILGWVLITPDPAKYAKELHGAGAYYGNKVIVAFKDKNVPDLLWAKSWLNIMNELVCFIRSYYRTGLVWNTDTSSGQLRPQFSQVPPPPPPPPTFDLSSLSLSDTAASENDPRSALLKELNKGADITKGLKKVDRSSHPHIATPVVQPSAVAKTMPAKSQKKQSPVLELDGRKWRVEYQENNHDVVVQSTAMNQAIYVYKCDNTQITVKGKVNCITLDTCRKVYILFDDIVSSLEIINSERIQAQPLGKLPTAIIDKADGVIIYLTSNSLDVEVVSSKSSEINIALPDPHEFHVEKPVPEQFKTTVVNGNLHTVPIEKN